MVWLLLISYPKSQELPKKTLLSMNVEVVNWHYPYNDLTWEEFTKKQPQCFQNPQDCTVQPKEETCI